MILNIDEVNLESLDSVLDLNLPALDELTKEYFPTIKKAVCCSESTPFLGL
jgi:hypothetical protein